jgi:membrane protein DedA with SNARE-associated domain/membrane-associated phospholipid phosphatase
MDHIQPYLDYLSQHPTWAIAIVFLIAFGEALLIIGLFVPSTAVLVGAGILVGAGHLPFWPVFLATAIGAIAGDQISYWAGRFFGQRLKALWPLNRFPQLVERGEGFVKSHGGKSIALGRFVPGVKAVIPGIVGMLGMSQLYFLSVNVSSGLVWAALHLVPGLLIGQGLALAGELSGRLAFVLLEILVLLAIAGWVIRLLAAVLSPYLDHVLERIANWAKAKKGRSMHRFGRAIAPENPRSLLIVFFIAVLVLGIFALAILMSGVVSRNAFPAGDLSVFNLMREIRNAPADEFMIPITMLGDWFVLQAMIAAIVAWLIWHRAWRAAIASSATFVFAALANGWMNDAIHRLRPINHFVGPELYSFPSIHATMAATTFGILAVLASHAMSRWSRSLIYAVCGLAAIMISYTRVYLGVHWISDVLGGMLIGMILVAAFGVAIEAIPPRRIRPLGLLVVAFCAFVAAGTYHIAVGLDRAEVALAPPEKYYTINAAQWQASEWQKLPIRRIDLAGKPEEPFSFQWAGTLESLQSQLTTRQWIFSNKWTWRDIFAYLDPNAKLSTVAPRPALHQGLKAKLTMIQDIPDAPDRRLVLRAFKTDAILDTTTGKMPIFLVSLTQESLRKAMHTYAVPVLVPAPEADVKQIRQDLAATPNAASVIEHRPNEGGEVTLITAP